MLLWWLHNVKPMPCLLYREEIFVMLSLSNTFKNSGIQMMLHRVIKDCLSCALYSESMKSYVFPSLPLEQYRIELILLPLMMLGYSCQNLCKCDLPRPDGPGNKECFQIRPLFYILKNFSTVSDRVSMNFLFLMANSVFAFL